MSVTAAPGFVAGGAACGIKPSGAPDLGAAGVLVHDEAEAVAMNALFAPDPVELAVARATIAEWDRLRDRDEWVGVVAGVMGGPPSAMLVPPLLALADGTDATGRDLALAYVVGFETECRIARGVHYTHYDKGWHPTATLGVFGAAAACAKLMGLEAPQIATALALAASAGNLFDGALVVALGRSGAVVERAIARARPTGVVALGAARQGEQADCDGGG